MRAKRPTRAGIKGVTQQTARLINMGHRPLIRSGACGPGKETSREIVSHPGDLSPESTGERIDLDPAIRSVEHLRADRLSVLLNKQLITVCIISVTGHIPQRIGLRHQTTCGVIIQTLLHRLNPIIPHQNRCDPAMHRVVIIFGNPTRFSSASTYFHLNQIPAVITIDRAETTYQIGFRQAPPPFVAHKFSALPQSIGGSNPVSSQIQFHGTSHCPLIRSRHGDLNRLAALRVREIPGIGHDPHRIHLMSWSMLIVAAVSRGSSQRRALRFRDGNQLTVVLISGDCSQRILFSQKPSGYRVEAGKRGSTIWQSLADQVIIFIINLSRDSALSIGQGLIHPIVMEGLSDHSIHFFKGQSSRRIESPLGPLSIGIDDSGIILELFIIKIKKHGPAACIRNTVNITD